MYFGSRTGGAQPVTFTLGAESGQRSRLHLLWEQNRGARPKRETFGNFLRGAPQAPNRPKSPKKIFESRTHPNLGKHFAKFWPGATRA